jgi:hypothetical protein
MRKDLELTATDPIQAELQVFDLLKIFNQATQKEKAKIKAALKKAITKTERLKQTFIRDIYERTCLKLEQMDYE